MKISLLTFATSLGSCLAAPVGLGISYNHQKRNELPTLTLPYGTWRAASYNANGDIYTFKNIRFGAPPVGDLRWAKPAPPAQETEIQDGSYGPICRQTPLRGPQLTGPGATSPVGQAVNQFLGGIPLPTFKTADEDCLFLDIYVPGKAIRNPSLKLPVISYFFGGAYVFGAKDQFDPILPFYHGTGVIQQAQGNLIFVSSNYRVGAYGWLAGDTMEKEGLPNAGLYDQRAVLQWIQDHISLVGGDKTQVSAWGESAGAGSIMHHLVSFGGQQDPLFTKAVMLSPAFEPLYDRKGYMEDTFQNFTRLAGCAGQGVACLRAASAEALNTANIALIKAGPMGTFPVGPSTDGNLIRQLASLELASGNYYKDLTSVILSHVSDEAELFVPSDITTDAGFDRLLDFSFPPIAKAAGVDEVVKAHYPPVMSANGLKGNYTTERARIKAYIGEQGFQCIIRYLSDAYAGRNYNMEYAVFPGLHATDLLPAFYDINLDLSLFGGKFSIPLVPGFGIFAQQYQSYLVSHALTPAGDPNVHRKPFTPVWPRAQTLPSQNIIPNVLRAGTLGFKVTSDEETSRDRCAFWQNVAAAVTIAGGYVPPSRDGSGMVPTTYAGFRLNISDGVGVSGNYTHS